MAFIAFFLCAQTPKDDSGKENKVDKRLNNFHCVKVMLISKFHQC